VSNEDICKWRFTLFIELQPTTADPFACRYFFYENGCRNCFHNGHLKKSTDQVTKRTDLVEKDELEVKVDRQIGNLGFQLMSILLYQQTSWALKAKKIQKNYKSMIEQNSMLSNTPNQQSGMSPADKVISYLTSREDVSVVYLVTKVELGKQLVTTYTKSTRKKKTPKPQWVLHITFESNVVNNGGETLTRRATFTELTAASKDDGGTADSPEDTARAIYNSLGVEDNTEILLLIEWCTNKQRRLLALFPRSLTCDVIFKTNNEKRPVFHICGKTSSNETFTGMYVMLPSQAVWVFDFV
jgi:hypothetical protein